MKPAPLTSDPAWQEALDWLLRIEAAPHDAALKAERDGWIAADPKHARLYRKAEKVWRLTGEVAPAPAKVRPLPGWRRRPAIAAGLLAAAIAIAVFPEARLRLSADHVTGTGEIRQIVLEDGSVVTLDAGSAISAKLSADRRTVTLLRGQAYLQVTPDSARPFSVDAEGVRATVVGTEFDMRIRPAEIDVAVESGIVQVASSGMTTTRLGAGERVAVDRGTGSARQDRVPSMQVGAWRNGQLVVDGATVAEVVAELRRYHPGVIVLADEALAGKRVTGVYDLLHPAEALRAAIQPHRGVVRSYSPWLTVIAGS